MARPGIGECRLDDALSYRGNVTVISHSDPLVPIAWCLSAGSSHWRGEHSGIGRVAAN